MTNEEIEFIISQLKPYTKNTLLTESNINGIGKVEIEVETENDVNFELLKSVIEYIILNIATIKVKSNEILNSLARVKGIKFPEEQSEIEFNLSGISINNSENIHNQFKLVFGYDYNLVHQNEDTLGYRTVNFSGSKNCYYISGANWIY